MEIKAIDEVESSEKFNFNSSFTDNLPQILAGLNISLVVTSYQSQKLFFIRSDGKSIDTNFKSFPRPMGLAVSENRITLGIFKEILKFNRNDAVISSLKDGDKVDACFTPSASHTTGMINIHDIAYGESGLWVVNSNFSCLATIEPNHSFIPRWKPPFISKLAPEDRCHLNGMALKNGVPKYVTTFNTKDEACAWQKQDNNKKGYDGTLIDVETDEILLTGLCMPHSPRYYRGAVYFCESGTGSVCRFDPNKRKVTILIKLQGFPRGMDFYGPLMFVGLSKIRNSEINNPSPIAQEYETTYSGIWVINLETNQTVAWLRFDGDLSQIYDIGVLAGTVYPELIEPDHEKVAQIFNFPSNCL